MLSTSPGQPDEVNERKNRSPEPLRFRGFFCSPGTEESEIKKQKRSRSMRGYRARKQETPKRETPKQEAPKQEAGKEDTTEWEKKRRKTLSSQTGN